MILYTILGLAGVLSAVSYINDRRMIAKQKREKEALDKRFEQYFMGGKW